MGYGFDLVAFAAALSGVALAALGLLLVLIDRRTRGVVAFAAFAFLWGAQIIAANVSRMAADEATLSFWVHTYIALQIPIYVPLVYFAIVHVRPTGALGRNPLLPLFLALPAAAVLLFFAAEPALFVERVHFDAVSGLPTTETGRLLEPLVLTPFFLGFAVALALVYAKYERTKQASQRTRLLFVPAALLAFVSYITAKGTVVAVQLPLERGLPILVFMLPGLLVALGILVRSLLGPGREDQRAPFLIAFAGVPMVFGAVEGFTTLAGLRFETLALWRLLLVGLVVYGIARYRLFDLDLKMKRSLRPGFTLATLGVLFFLLKETLEFFLPGEALMPNLAGAATVGLLFFPVWRLADRTAHGLMSEVKPSQDYIYRRKVEVYRAALEENQERAAGGQAEEAFLGELRRRLGISRQEHLLISHLLPSPTGARGGARTPKAQEGDRFRVLKELGRGSFGRAVLAEDTVLGRTVVLKQPLAAWLHDQRARDDFLREARIMARIQHPNVVTLYEIHTDLDPPALVLEYVEGGTLREHLNARGSLRMEESMRVALDVLAGLGRVHEEGILHRDLKPENVLLTRDGLAKVTDFGVAHAPEAISKAATIAATDVPLQPGSVAYMSPEQARGDVLDARSDIYTLGVLLYECLTGQLPYSLRGLTAAEARGRIQNTAPRLPVEGLPAELEAPLRTALAKDAAERFASAGEMAEAITAATPSSRLASKRRQ